MVEEELDKAVDVRDTNGAISHICADELSIECLGRVSVVHESTVERGRQHSKLAARLGVGIGRRTGKHNLALSTSPRRRLVSNCY